jgi:hypothetical protein
LDGGLAALQTSEVRKLFVFFDDSGEASSASVEELLEFLLDNAVQTHCHRFAAIVARAARAAQRSGAAADADLVREVAAYLRRHDKKRDGSCRQAALEKTLHWTGIIHELQPLEVEDLLGALKLEQVTRRGEPVVDYALFLRQVLGDDALQAYPERGVVNRGPGTSRKERPTTARRRRYDSEEESEEEEPRRRRGVWRRPRVVFVYRVDGAAPSPRERHRVTVASKRPPHAIAATRRSRAPRRRWR